MRTRIFTSLMCKKNLSLSEFIRRDIDRSRVLEIFIDIINIKYLYIASIGYIILCIIVLNININIHIY